MPQQTSLLDDVIIRAAEKCHQLTHELLPALRHRTKADAAILVWFSTVGEFLFPLRIWTSGINAALARDGIRALHSGRRFELLGAIETTPSARTLSWSCHFRRSHRRPPSCLQSFQMALSSTLGGDALRLAIRSRGKLVGWLALVRLEAEFTEAEEARFTALGPALAPCVELHALRHQVEVLETTAPRLSSAGAGPAIAVASSELGLAPVAANTAGLALLERICEAHLVSERQLDLEGFLEILARSCGGSWTVERSACGGLLVLSAADVTGSPVRTDELMRRYTLTARQAQVLELLLKGQTQKEIADQLNISRHTVEAHISDLLRRTQSTHAAQLVARVWSQR